MVDGGYYGVFVLSRLGGEMRSMIILLKIGIDGLDERTAATFNNWVHSKKSRQVSVERLHNLLNLITQLQQKITPHILRPSRGHFKNIRTLLIPIATPKHIISRYGH